MRRNKKLAAAAMAVLTASAILTGCGNDAATNATAGNSAASENTDNAGNTGTEGEGEQTASGERPTITFMLQDFTGNALNNENSDKVVEKMEEYTNTHVDFRWEASDTYQEKFGVTLLDKDNIPMILTSPNGVDSNVLSAARRDAFWDLTEYLKDEEAYPNLSQADPETLKAMTVDGKIIGIYRTRNLGRYGMSYRTDWAEKVGVTEAPSTVDELYDMMDKFAHNDPDGNGEDDTYGMELCKYTGPLDIMQTWFGVGNDWVEQDGKLVPVHQTPEYMEALNWMKSLVDNGLVRKDWAAVDTTTWADGIKKGEAGVFVDTMDGAKGAWQYYIQQDVKSVVNSEETASITYVGPLAKDENSDPKTLAHTGYGGCFLITKEGAKTEEDLKNCLHYLDKMCDDEMLVLADYGLEGITWEYANEEKTELVKIDAALDGTQIPNAGLNQTLCYIPHEASVNPALQLDEPTKLMQEAQELNKTVAVRNPATEYLLNSEENEQNGLTLEQILDDARTQYVCGAIDEAGLQQAWQEWEERGGAKLIEEVNAQYQAK